ncbi:DUF2066 domain-containing protein [Thioalkalivibrio sp. ALE23]|uniref:DUF2066 domain-containing protein n=1 Tax=Thioalkalivibrio sp. ALE23 TaxID=1265495 RepID=UPI000377D941|nr:DUF2066 domain-containing protein [Thioalkalivibrio sp. ALE23]
MPAVSRSISAVALFLSLWLIALLPQAAGAGTLVVQSDAEEREAALAEGLHAALVRVAGLDSDAVRALADELRETPDDDELPAALERQQARDAGGYRLEFDRTALRRSLRDAAVPMIVGSRPSLLVWAVEEADGRRDLLGTASVGEDSGVLAALETLAGERDMPLLLPLGDLQDRREARISDIVGRVTEPLFEAARRYGPDGLILLHLRPAEGETRARALLVHRDREYRAEATAADAPAAARRATAAALDRMGADLARVPDEPEWITVGFTGVAGFDGFRQLRARLGGMEAIERVQLDSLGGAALTLRLRTGLDAEALGEVLQDAGFTAAGEEEREEAGRPDAALWLGVR